jgi:hypothetical protein
LFGQRWIISAKQVLVILNLTSFQNLQWNIHGFNAWCGDIDLIGGKKPQSYYRDILWDRSKLEMLVHAPIP